MKSRSSVVESLENSADVVQRHRQRPYRHKVRTLSHVNLDAGSGAILRDVNEFGLALQAVTPLAPQQQVHLRFELPASRMRIDASARIAWTDSWGQAGVQFLNLPQRSERLLKEWIFSQILSSAYLFSSCESAWVEGNRDDCATELLFSASARPAIRLAPRPSRPTALPGQQTRSRSVRPLWWPVPISLITLSNLADGLILLCAVLLFAVMSLAMINILPTWPVTLALATGVTAVFVAVYWFLFAFWFGSTPGEHLARLAWAEPGHSGEEDQTRFR